MKNFKKVLLIMSIATSLLNCAVISLGALEAYLEFKEAKKKKKSKNFMTHRVFGFIILTFCNIIIAANIIYLTQYGLRGKRHSWYVSCNYFLYILCEIMCVIVIFTMFDYLDYPVPLASVVAALFGMLFFFTCVMEKVLNDLEDEIAATIEQKMYEGIGTRKPRKKQDCERINLTGPLLTQKASVASKGSQQAHKSETV